MKQVERVRGAAEVPLNELGKAQADYLGARIAAKGGIDTLGSSDLGRDRETSARVLRKNPGARFLGSSKALGPWHQGSLEGMSHEEAKPALKYFVEHPEEAIPGQGLSGVPGESLNSMLRRAVPEIQRHVQTMRPGERRLLMSHHSLVKALHGMLAPGAVDVAPGANQIVSPRAFMEKDLDEPGSVFKVDHDGRNLKGILKVDLESGSRDFDKGGLWIARHGATPFSGEDQKKGLEKLGHSK